MRRSTAVSRARRLVDGAGRRGGGAAAFPTGDAPELMGAAAAPERIGAYRLTGLIGQSGMGSVWRGERVAGDFDHVVAIMLIRPGPFADALINRFAREQRVLARLSHPNIARLFDGGALADSAPSIIMELVDGMVPGVRSARAREPTKAARASIRALRASASERSVWARSRQGRAPAAHRGDDGARFLLSAISAKRRSAFVEQRPLDA